MIQKVCKQTRVDYEWQVLDVQDQFFIIADIWTLESVDFRAACLILQKRMNGYQVKILNNILGYVET